jgi:hypothetical protein
LFGKDTAALALAPALVAVDVVVVGVVIALVPSEPARPPPQLSIIRPPREPNPYKRAMMRKAQRHRQPSPTGIHVRNTEVVLPNLNLPDVQPKKRRRDAAR